MEKRPHGNGERLSEEAPQEDNAWLTDYFRDLAHRRPAGPTPDRQPDPVERAWPAPARHGGPAEGLIVPLHRHPRFEALAFDVPVLPVARSSRSVSRGRQSRFHSMKNRRTLRARAELEFDHFRDSELDDDVASFVEEPLTFRYLLDGRMALARPDAFVVRRHASEFVDIKYEADASHPDQERRWPAIAAALGRLGLGYRVLTERHLRRRPRIDNVRMIFEHRFARLPAADDLAAILAVVEPGTTIGHLLSITALKVDLPVVCALARRGCLALDLNRPLGTETEVWGGRGPFRMPGLVVGL